MHERERTPPERRGRRGHDLRHAAEPQCRHRSHCERRESNQESAAGGGGHLESRVAPDSCDEARIESIVKPCAHTGRAGTFDRRMSAPPQRPRGFASDNYAGVHPDVLAAIAGANDGSHAGAYGADAHTARLDALVARLFGPRARAHVVFNGTGANVIALSACCARWEAVLCAESAHVQCDEGGAPEVVAGLKLHLVPTPDGKLRPENVHAACGDGAIGNVHHAQPRAVSISNTTELGTLYSPAEVRALADAAHAHGLLLHMDGARVSNAAAALGVELAAFTADAGVDVLSFGGTKIGCLAAEAVIVLDAERTPALAAALPFLRKTSAQLSSKMRFASAQLLAMFDGPDPLWRRLAAHANAMARRLDAGVRGVEGVAVPTACEANAVFPVLPAAVADELRGARGWRFYTWSAPKSQYRWMASWDTTPEDVDALLADLRDAMAAHRAAAAAAGDTGAAKTGAA